jgi:hypothetical protein
MAESVQVLANLTFTTVGAEFQPAGKVVPLNQSVMFNANSQVPVPVEVKSQVEGAKCTFSNGGG